MTHKAERAAVYARISEDPRQTELGVVRQREDCEALITARGWAHVQTFSDNDIAVLTANAERPGYAALMDAVERGEVTHIVALGASRLWRNRRERAEAIEMFHRHGVVVALVKGGDIDLSSAAGRMYAGVLGEVDTMESELKGERVARAAQQRAEMGKANGHAAFGWRRVRTRNASGEVVKWHDEEDPEAADVVRGIVDDLVALKSIRAITLDLNERAVAPPRVALRVASGGAAGGAKWLPSTVRKVALRRANIGRIERGREDFGDALAPAIVDRDKYDRVVAILTDPRRRASVKSDGAKGVRPGARRHLLSGGEVGACDGCGSELRVKRAGDHALYACNASRGCTARRVEWVDEMVARAVAARLGRPDARVLLTRDDAPARQARERADAIDAKIDRLQDDYDADVIDRRRYERSMARYRSDLAEAKRGAARAIRGLSPDLVAELAGPHARARWDAINDVAQRRALIEAMGLRVRLRTGMRGGPGFKPDSVAVSFVRVDADGRTVGEDAADFSPAIF